MEHLGAHAEGFLPALRADRQDHELLDVNVVGSVGAAVEDVHHRHGQGLGVHAADVVVEGDIEGVGGSAGAGQGDAEDGVGAQAGLVGGAVELDEHLVDGGLVEDVQAQHGLGDLGVDVLNGAGHALAQVTALVAVAELAGLVHAGGGAGGNGSAADGAVVEGDLDLNGRIAAGVHNFAPGDVNDLKILFHDDSP